MFYAEGAPITDERVPAGPIEARWDRRRFSARLVNPANRRNRSVIVVGTGLAGGSAAATLAELGYQVKSFCYQDSPRRAHSIAAQGGINAAKNYRNDGDSVHRLFYDTVKGGDFRSRESNVHRLAQISVEIIDQCVAQGVPFAREYGGLLDTRSFGGAQVSRTFYARGQTGQQLLLGAYQALERQIAAGRVEMHPRTEMLDLIVVDGRARGIVVRDLVSGAVSTHFADAVVLATGGYGNVFHLSTNAKGCNTTAIWRAHRRRYPAFGNLVPRDIASRAAKNISDEKRGVYLDFADAIGRLGAPAVEQRYGNLFEMYQRITGDDPYRTPMRIYPAVHYTMGGLWVDYDLRSTIPGLYVIGEANFSDHGANRLGASALMQGLADGYFVLPGVIGDYLADAPFDAVDDSHPVVADTMSEVRGRVKTLLAVDGDRTVESFHRELGRLMWDECGMERDEAGLRKALERIPELREEFWRRVRVPGTGERLNQELEKAGRVADFFELAELMCVDALHRAESCGGHFRSESQTADGEALRDDANYSYVAAWEYTGVGRPPVLHKEELVFEHVTPSTRSYS